MEKQHPSATKSTCIIKAFIGRLEAPDMHSYICINHSYISNILKNIEILYYNMTLYNSAFKDKQESHKSNMECYKFILAREVKKV